MSLLSTCLALLLLIAGVAGFSSGEGIDACSVTDPYGCTPGNFGTHQVRFKTVENRLDCLDSGRIMDWALRPTRTDHYRLFAEQTQYTPNKIVKLTLQTNAYRAKVRGLMIYAEDTNGKRVGDWQVIADNPPSFRHMETCEKTLIHYSGAYFLLDQPLYFRAPPVNTGTITFRALVKIGDANRGAFHWPNADADFAMTEGPQKTIQFYRSQLDESCDEACARERLACDESATRQTVSAAQMSVVSEDVLCRQPFFHRCNSQVGATSSFNQICFIHDESMCTSATQVTCSSRSSDEQYGYRLCACRALGAAETPGRTRPPTTQRPPSSNKDESTTAAAAALSPTTTAKTIVADGQTSLTQRVYDPVFDGCKAGTDACPCDDQGQCLAGLSCYKNTLCVRDKAECEGGVSCPCQATSDCKTGLLCAAFETPSSSSSSSSSTSALKEDNEYGSICVVGSRDGGESPESVSAGAQTRFSLTTALFLALFSSSTSLLPSASWLSGVIGVMVALEVLPQVQAHNWLTSNSRAKGASQVLPCLPRNSLEPHVQVGKDQTFSVEWRQGHSGTHSYFVVVHESDFDKLAKTGIRTVREYIAEAPNGQQRIDPKFRRFHRAFSRTLENSGKGPKVISRFKGFVEKTDPDWLERPLAMGSFLDGPLEDLVQLEYPEEAMTDDRRVAYLNEKWPWIEAAHVYEHRVGRAHHSDTARFAIPGRKGSGKYIVYYLWSGYTDCVDVEFFVDKQIEPLKMYGELASANKWIRIPHCHFPDTRPHKQGGSYSQCHGVIDTVSGCKADCERYLPDGCYGVQLAPRQHPTSVPQRFRNETMFAPSCGLERIPDQFDLACQAVRPRLNTDRTPEYIVTDDPSDPAFYATCYLRQAPVVTFSVSPSTAEPVSKAQFLVGQTCLECASTKANAYDYVTPRWQLADKCVPCDEINKNKNKVPFNPASRKLRVLAVNASCDGFSSYGAVNRWQSSSSHTCSGTPVCNKKLDHGNKGQYPYWDLEACLALAAADPECSALVSHGNRKVYQDYCVCYLRAPKCCGDGECAQRATGLGNLYKLEE